MKYAVRLFSIAILLLISACQADVCPPGSVETLADPSLFPTADAAAEAPAPTTVEIGNKSITVDRVVHGPLCNDTWSGTVYVACDVQVAAWTEEEGPKFLEGCDLKIEPNTVVYVASHNNAAYYNGCSACHGGARGQ